MKKVSIKEFKKLVWNFYRKHKRIFPWRSFQKGKDINPYHVLVSEVMLQQTQASRVVEKYKEFLKKFPTTKKLSSAPLSDVLKVWQGLGYNRRAVALKRCAEIIFRDHKNIFPKAPEELCNLPGIGPATAGDLLAFAWNIPATVIETNIRTVFIHHFFHDRQNISDKEIVPLIEATLDRKNPREWYYALMDYGAMLKKLYPNPSRKSKHYNRQSPFAGSNREFRSKILKAILKSPGITTDSLKQTIPHKRFNENIENLEKEGFITRKQGRISVL